LTLALTLVRRVLTAWVLSMGASGAVSTAVLMLVLAASMALAAVLGILTLTLGVSTLGSEGWLPPIPPIPPWVDYQGSRA
jgi:hypothetical protein